MIILQTLLHNKMFLCPIIGWATAQILKTFINMLINREFNPERLIGSGGMPSSHSSTVVSLMYATAYCKGITGFEFPMATTLAIIVMYDAMNVRMETGKQAIILNLFLKNEEINKMLKEADRSNKMLKEADRSDWAKIILKEYVGHTPIQVLGGIVVGVVVGYLVCRFL